MLRQILASFCLLAGVSLSAQTTVTTSFKDNTTTGWVLGGTGYTPITTSGTIDTAGNGWLRLTDNGNDRATYAYYGTPVASANRTVFASFDYATWNGSGADGLGFFLFDGSKSFGIGAAGGSLGYAQKTLAGGGGADISGMNGGYLGIGLDDYGNYANPTEGRVGGLGSTPNAISVRGPGQGLTGYDYLGGSGTMATQMDFPTYTARPVQTGTDYRHVEMLLSATNQLSVWMQFGASGTLTQVLNMDLSGYTRPDTLGFGFFAGTGGSTEIHELRSFSLSAIAANLWDNGAGNTSWSSGNNWDTNLAPATGADILLNNTYVNTAQTIDVGAGSTRDIRSLQIDAPFNYTLSNGTLNFTNNGLPGTYGINVTQTNGSGTAQTIGSNITLANDINIGNASSAPLVLNGTVGMGGNSITVTGTGSTTMNGVVSGTGGSITKNDMGNLTLAGNNTFTAGVTLNNGIITTNNNNALGTGTVILNNGTLQSTAGSTVGNILTLQGNATFSAITTSGALTQTNGSYTLNMANATQSGQVNLSNNNTARTLTVQSDAGTSTISGAIVNGGTGASGLTKTGAGTLVLSNTGNAFTGTLAINGGTLQLGASNVLTNTVPVNIAASGTLNLNGYSEKIGNLTAAGGATLDFGNSAGANTFVFDTYTAPTSGVMVVNNWLQGTDTLASTVAGQTVSSIYLSGYGVAQEAGARSSTLYGNAYLLTPIVQTGVVWQGSTNATYSTGSNWAGGARPTSTQIAIFDNTGTARPNVTLDAGRSAAGIKFDATAPSYNISGANTWTLAGTTPYIQQKSSFNQTIGVTTLALSASTVMDITGSGNLTISSTLSGSGSNVIRDGAGSGKLILSGNNTPWSSGGSAAVYINTGIVQAANTGALGTNAATVSDGGTLELSGGISPTNAVSLRGAGAGGAGAVHNVSGTNTMSGTLTMGAATTIAADTGTTLNLTGNLTGPNVNTTFNGSGTSNINVNQINMGTGGVIINGGNVTFQSGTANTYTGITAVNSGTLNLGKTAGVNAIAGNSLGIGDGTNAATVKLITSNQIADNATVTINANGTFNLNNQTETIAGLASPASSASISLGTGTLTVNNSSDNTYAGAFSGAGTVTKTGTGRTVLSGNSTGTGYTGTTNVNAGTVSVQNNGALGTSAVYVNNGGNLQIQNGIALANSITLNGNGNLANAGAIENVSGNDSLNGTITVASPSKISSTAGTLTLNGNITGTNQNLTVGGNGNVTITSTVALGSGSLIKTDLGTLTLAGGGTYTGATTVSGGTLALGANNTLSSASALSIAAGATFDVNGFSNTLGGLSGSGKVDFGNGSLSLGGTNTFSGTFVGTGALNLLAGTNLTLASSINDPSLTVNMAGGTISLGNQTQTVGALHITGNTVLDFGNSAASILTATNVIIDTGVTLSITNWVNMQDFFYATGSFVGLNPTTSVITPATPNVRGAAPQNQVAFSGFSNNSTVWMSYDKQITPAPEPATYGALMIGAALGFLGFRRWSKRTTILST